MISNFNEVHPEINVTVEYLDYTNGDDQINTAIEGGQAPDIVLEGPERLVANWGARGLMADLSDMWTDEAKEAIYDSVESACQNNDGVFYEYPLCMTAHTMAINKDIFEKAVKAVYDSGQQNVGAVYCSGQGGDQGTRALAIFTFINSWNDYFMQLIMLSSTSNLTISLGIAKLQAENATDFGLIMAGAALAAVPIIIVFLVLQKYFTKGITMGAVKG